MAFFREWFWLIFPFMGFAFGGFGMWMSYRMQRERMALLRMYAEKGVAPPPEVAKAADPAADPYGYGYGYGRYGKWGRRGPYWEWRRVILFASLAIGFGFANYWEGGDFDFSRRHGDIALHHGNMPFGLLTIIFGVLALGSLLFAILASVWKDR